MSEQSSPQRTEPTGAPKIGDELKAAREALNFSQEEVAKRLNLKIHIIESLENNTFSNNTFTRGYIRSYAKLVSLPENKVSSLLKHMHSIEPKRALGSSRSSPQQATATDKPVRFTTYLLIGILILLLVIWYFWQHADNKILPEIKVLTNNITSTNHAAPAAAPVSANPPSTTQTIPVTAPTPITTTTITAPSSNTTSAVSTTTSNLPTSTIAPPSTAVKPVINNNSSPLPTSNNTNITQ